VHTVTSYLQRSQPSNVQTAQVFESLQQRRFVEGFLGLVYCLAALTARYDGIGHLGVAYLITPQNGIWDAYATTPIAGCSARYGPATTAAARSTTRTVTAPTSPTSRRATSSPHSPSSTTRSSSGRSRF
jgi:hypothetical protein